MTEQPLIERALFDARCCDEYETRYLCVCPSAQTSKWQRPDGEKQTTLDKTQTARNRHA
jgi:hypothetical protein